MKKTYFIKALALSLCALMLLFLMIACSCGNENGGETAPPQVAGQQGKWNRITVFVPDGMDLVGSALDSSDPDTVYVQKKSDQLSYFLISITTAESAEASIKTQKELNSGEDVSFKAGDVEWKGVKFKYAGLVDNFAVYGTVDGKVVMVSGSRFACDSNEALVVLGSIKVSV
ncbi:MAG: hypothetical protein IKI64_04230 [Clostridia bacterium]|nr:hypothetical protein [Clostridia bacterium]